jgi:hypothetical protein
VNATGKNVTFELSTAITKLTGTAAASVTTKVTVDPSGS